MDLGNIDKILEKYNFEHHALIAILHDIQAESGYLPQPVLEHVATQMEVPLSRVYGIATFYQSFKLKPRAPHRIQVCYGTACYCKGAPDILKKLEASLGGKAGNCGEGSGFDVETVNCPGTCAQSPLILIDGNEVGEVKPESVEAILAEYKKK